MPCNNCHSNSGCDCPQSLSFRAKTLDLLDIEAGETVQFLLKFHDPLLPITSDTFTMVIKNSGGSTVQTLTVGSGFTIMDPLVLSGVISPLAAGKYKHSIVWHITASGANPKIGVGKIVVS